MKISPRARRRIQKALRKRENRGGFRYYGTLGDANGIIKVPGQKNMVYVMPPGADLPLVVYNSKVSKVKGLHVSVGYDDADQGVLKVLGARAYQSSTEGGGGGGEIVTDLPDHAPNHYITGIDPAWIDSLQVMNISARGIGGMIIRVEAGYFGTSAGFVHVVRTEFDLTAYIPAAGALWMLVQVSNAGVVSLVEGTTVDAITDLTLDDIPLPDNANIALAAVKLYFGQTAISNDPVAGEVIDARFFSYLANAFAVEEIDGAPSIDHPTIVKVTNGRLTDNADTTCTIDVEGNVQAVSDTPSLDLTLTGRTLSGVVLPAGVDHGGLGGLVDDDHTQYVFLAGRAGGQVVYGGTASGNSLTLNSTAHATKGYVLLATGGGYVGIGVTAPASVLHIKGTLSIAVIGASNLLTADGTFATTTGWTVGAGWAIGSGVATHSTGNTEVLSGTSTATSTGRVYKVVFTVAVTTPGDGFTVSLGGLDSGTTITTAGTKTLYCKSTATGTLAFTPGPLGTFVGTIDDVAIYVITPSGADMTVESSDGTGNNLQIRSTGTDMLGSFAIGSTAGAALVNDGGGNAGRYNTFVGYNAGRYCAVGFYNVGIGNAALTNCTTGAYNMGIGVSSLTACTTGTHNAGIGTNTLRALTTGATNMAVGTNALYSLTTGSSNVGIGYSALYNLTTGSYNIGIGFGALIALTGSAANNVAIGYRAGYTNTAGQNNVFIGGYAGYNETGSDRLYISNSTTSTPLIYGLFSGAGAGVTIYSQNTAGVPLIVQGTAGQASNLLSLRDSAATVLTAFGPAGKLVTFAGMGDGTNIALGTTTGTKIGTATNQKLGFYNSTPVVQQTGCAVPTDLATAITAITALRTALNNLGLTTAV